MIKISENIQLRIIIKDDCELLFNLMNEIYPPAYQHFWVDAGKWYINSQYSEENILKELFDEKASYYFILYDNEIVGSFRFIWDEKLKGLEDRKQVKLHRIYIHPKTQGKGIGQKLISWLENLAIQENYKTIWLDAMNEQAQAFEFYKKLGYTYHSHTFLPFDLMHEKLRKMSQLYKKLT
jgi:ribosomal protein S18 acetylase RimI-like enzyme